MASYIRAQVAGWLDSDPKKDKITNTVYFSRGVTIDPTASTDWQQIADDVKGAWLVGQQVYMTGIDRIQVKVYSMEDAEPRHPKAESLSNVELVGTGVRETALCMSFRGAGQTPRDRGRIFLGPFSSSNQSERPTTSVRSTCLALASRLADIGGTNVDWSVFSPTTYAVEGNYGAAFKPVKFAWVDDAWDTQRSRGLPPLARTTVTLDE